ncbi:Na/Pi symporter [Bacillaceae bacterium W0354]
MYALLISICIYIGLFLFGITLMRIGFKGLTIGHIKNIKPDLSPINGFIVGLIVTLLLQSSSASIALLITFLASIKLSLPFAVCYLIGANIGTTFTAQLFVWNDVHLMFICLLSGLLFILLPYAKSVLIGSILFGLGVIFSALNGLESLVHSIPSDTISRAVESPTNSPMILTMFGVMLTVIIQSSTAAVGMMMSFSSDGLVPLIQSYYIILGANIGTCFTILLVSIGQPYYARITAYAHIWINVLGAIIAYPLFISQPLTQTAISISNNPEQQVVIISILYNVLVGIIFLLFLKPFCKFLTFIHRS